MYCDAPILVQLVTAFAVVIASAYVARRFGLSTRIGQDVPVSSPRFWWTLAVFMGPLGVANRVLFCDGLFLQLALVVLIAGAGIWLGDRVLTRRR